MIIRNKLLDRIMLHIGKMLELKFKLGYICRGAEARVILQDIEDSLLKLRKLYTPTNEA